MGRNCHEIVDPFPVKCRWRHTGAVSPKGEYAAIRGYPMAIRRAIQTGSRLSF
jgi:hypothetical protein